jgi:hypothetical protein
VVGSYPVRDAWFPSRVPLEGIVVSRFWAVIGDPWYPGYKTPTVAPEPSVEWVAGAVHSMGGRIGTHMLQWVPPRDSVVRFHGHNTEFHGGTHCIAPEVAAKLKVQEEAKFHIYCFVLH